ncbi:MAG: hypothetical protein H0V07_07060 [Propionibacteriales bacterium]|nr:hypothetical protein [Propionibacteriales bacterium]
MFKKTAIMAAPVLASAALVAAGLSGSTIQANASDGGDPHAPGVTSAKLVSTSGCNGTTQRRTYNKGMSGSVFAGSDTGAIIVPGTLLKVRGPSSGRDVLSVNLSAQSYTDNGSQGRVKVLLDGVPMGPSDLNTGSLSYADGISSFAQNYCRKIGPGRHGLRVVISDNDFGAAGSYSFGLYDPMIHVELSK